MRKEEVDGYLMRLSRRSGIYRMLVKFIRKRYRRKSVEVRMLGIRGDDEDATADRVFMWAAKLSPVRASPTPFYFSL